MSALITRESLRSAGACHSDERIAEWVPEAGVVVSPETVAEAISAGVSREDIHWALAMAAVASDRVLREHACWCARRALALVPDPDPRRLKAVEVAERFALGEATRDELAAARDAAWAAAWDAAWAAAWAAARDAARDAAWDAQAAYLRSNVPNPFRPKESP